MAMARRWTPQRFVTLRRIRVIACIAATSIALAGSFAFTARKSVALNINGQTTQVTTYAMTATRLLEEQGVDIKTHDIVTTSSGDQLANHAVVTVQSAYQTTINIDGTAVPFWTVATSYWDFSRKTRTTPRRSPSTSRTCTTSSPAAW